MGTAVRQICIPAKQLCDRLNLNTGNSAGTGEEKRTFCINFGSLFPLLCNTALLQCPRTNKWNQPMRLQQHFANLWMRKAVILDYTEQESFLLPPSHLLCLYGEKMLAGNQSLPSLLIFFRHRFSPCSTYRTRFLFFIITYPAPSAFFIQCKETVNAIRS